MGPLIKNQKDFYSGLMYAVLGIAALIIARKYNMGSSVRMGPGYFPTMLGALMTIVGVISIVRSFFGQPVRVAPFAWKEIILVLGGVVVFGLIVRGAGLGLSLTILVMISARASPNYKLGSALMLAIAASLFSVLVFVKGLGLPFPIIGSWFGA